MSDCIVDELMHQQNEDEFFRMAGRMIAEADMADFRKLQDEVSEPPPELLARFHEQNRELILRSCKKKAHHVVFHRLMQAAAAAMICVGVTSTAMYITVDAARNSINNFFLEQFEDHAAVKPDDGSKNSGCTVPKDWNGPVTPGWIPERYTDVIASTSESIYGLFYSSTQENDILLIHIAPGKFGLNLDTEDMEYCSEISVQGVSGKIYSKSSENQYALFFVKNAISIFIRGSVSVNELTQIANQIIF